MDSSQRLLRLKIITGYVVLVLLFLLVLALYYREHGKLAVMDREAQSLLTRTDRTDRRKTSGYGAVGRTHHGVGRGGLRRV